MPFWILFLFEWNLFFLDNPDRITCNRKGPAVEGLIRVLKAARDANVKRVVMTSNFGAVGFSTVTTGAGWTVPNEPGLSVYEKSKSRNVGIY